MKIRVYVVDFESPRWLRRVLSFVAAPLLVAALVTIVAAAPQQWKTNDPLTAGDLNKLSVVTTAAGTRYSVGATKYCGLSASVTTGAFAYMQGTLQLTGYAAAKANCEASVGCASSPTAHMCSSEELIRSTQLGIVPTESGWMAGGIGSVVNGSSGMESNDCDGWIQGTAAQDGAIWFLPSTPPIPPQGKPAFSACNSAIRVLCCD
jgi:hypothetical protein